MKHLAMLACAVLVMTPLSVPAQTATMTKTVTTTPPLTGNPVVTYTWEISTDNGATWTFARTSTTPSTTITIPILVAVKARVAGIDALGNQGVWSPVSDPYTGSLGTPGGCGKPSWL